MRPQSVRIRQDVAAKVLRLVGGGARKVDDLRASPRGWMHVGVSQNFGVSFWDPYDKSFGGLY